jgi:uncharacterized protein with HEPN domain
MKVLLADILDCIDAINGFVAPGKSIFLEDRRPRDAVVRNLEVIGEAVKRLSASVRTRFPEIPWRRIAGMRDKLIHDHGRGDLEAVWTIVEDHLPPLRAAVSRAAQADS